MIDDRLQDTLDDLDLDLQAEYKPDLNGVWGLTISFSTSAELEGYQRYCNTRLDFAPAIVHDEKL